MQYIPGILMIFYTVGAFILCARRSISRGRNRIVFIDRSCHVQVETKSFFQFLKIHGTKIH